MFFQLKHVSMAKYCVVIFKAILKKCLLSNCVEVRLQCQNLAGLCDAGTKRAVSSCVVVAVLFMLVSERDGEEAAVGGEQKVASSPAASACVKTNGNIVLLPQCCRFLSVT